MKNVIYELHVRDFTIHPSSGVSEKNRGKFLGLVESGTTCNGLSTGIDHMVDLGVTHVQIMPVQGVQHADTYNWGYDPWDFNAVNPQYGTKDDLRVMVDTFHSRGIKVILDVVYNHVPAGHFFDKSWYLDADLSGCGHTLNVYNDTVNEFVLESLEYWLTEFDIDGFRFDLMGIFPIFRLNEWSDCLRKIKPSILLYGEPWAGYHDHRGYWMDDKAIECNAHHLTETNVGVFNSHFRDTAIQHFVHGKHQDLGNATGLVNPTQSINYVTCHDGYCLHDTIRQANEWDTWRVAKEIISFQCETPGTPFIFSGDEFLRSKKMVHNTWNLGDEYNAIDWTYKTKNKIVFDFYKDKIKLTIKGE